MAGLAAYIERSLSRPAADEIALMAEHVRGFHGDVEAVLAYGSCLRGDSVEDTLIDLYVLTGSMRGVTPNPVSRFGCRFAPPNVYFAELAANGRRCRSKYAVLPLDLFGKWMTRKNPYFWARFSQPSALVYAANREARQAVVSALATAVETASAHAKALPAGLLESWIDLYSETYRTELRAENGAARARQIVEANREYFLAAAGMTQGVPKLSANWKLRRLTGKLWSIARLVKASFTFSGGADYIAWKIERHSGQKLPLSDWQRRHPVLAGICLLPRLIFKRAVR